MVWSTYLQQFHLNIKYKKGNTNNVADFLSGPQVAALNIFLNFCGHETSGWCQLYKNDPEFAYRPYASRWKESSWFPPLGRIICYLGHLWILSSEHAKLIWEAHYNRVTGHFGVEKTMVVLQKYFYWPKLWLDVGPYICPRHRQSNHQEARIVHSSAYSQPTVGIHLHGLHVWPPFCEEW